MSNNTIALVVYLVGFFVTYIFFKKYIRDENETTWSDIFGTFGAALLSWITIFIVLIMIFYEWIKETNIKPPKWL